MFLSLSLYADTEYGIDPSSTDPDIRQPSCDEFFDPPEGPFILFVSPVEKGLPVASDTSKYNNFITPNVNPVYIAKNIYNLNEQIPDELLEMIRTNGAKLMYFDVTSHEYKVAIFSDDGNLDFLNTSEFFRELFSDTSHSSLETES